MGETDFYIKGKIKSMRKFSNIHPVICLALLKQHLTVDRSIFSRDRSSTRLDQKQRQ